VVVVDDGSSDNTPDIAQAAGAIVVRHERNLGKGAALNTGFRKARQLGADVVVTLDGDGQHRPEELAQVVIPVLSGEADIVIGSRYLESECDVPRHRAWGHRVFNLITRLASGTPASDSQSGYRAFSSKAVEAISFQSTGFSVESEMQFIAREFQLKLVEVPITARYTDRPKRPVVAHGTMVLNGILHLVGQYRPLLFFGLPGAILLLVGISWGLWVVEIFRRTRTLAAGYAMLSVLMTIVGMLSLSTGIILHSVRGLIQDLDRLRNPEEHETGFRER
jgi:glycosyltransferase involved in cell wall biosynthesis